MRPTKLYLDLDGVFADFNSRCREHLENNDWTPAGWKVLERIPNLFLGLNVLPGAKDGYKELKSICRVYNVKMEILTALPKPTANLITAPKDKLDWVREHIDTDIPVNCSAGWENKVHWVAPTHVLIDDMSRNTKLWDECGGISIHHKGDWKNTVDTFHYILHFA